MALSDREKVVLSVVGGLATVVVGYLVWRHEHTIGQADNAALLAQQQAANDAYAQQVEAAVSQQIPVASIGGGASGSAYDTGSTSNVTPAGDSNLAAILGAFFGNQGGGTGGVAPIPTPTPAQPVQPVSRTPSAGIGNTPVTTTPVGISGVTGLPRPVAPTVPNRLGAS